MPGNNNIIDSLAIEVVGKATGAINALNGLVDQLKEVRTKLVELGGTKVKINSVVSKATAENLKAFGDALSAIDPKQLSKFGDASKKVTKMTLGLNKDSGDNLRSFSEALKYIDTKQLSAFGKATQGISAIRIGITEKAVENFRAFSEVLDGFNVSKLRALGEVGKSFGGMAMQIRFNATEAENSNTAHKKSIPILQRVSSALKRTDSSVKRSGHSFNFANTAAGKFLNSIKRIAFYRAIRSALKAITQGFSEGIQNLYYWSQAWGTSFAPKMDQLATAQQYLKNGFASMFSPLIEYAIPIIDRLIDKFVDFFNFVQEGFARLVGAETWNKAIKQPVKYAEALDDASGSAKELKHQLLGFDELNVLNTPTASSRGSAKEQKDYSSMFELVKTNMDETESLGKRLAKMFNNLFDDPQKWGDVGRKIAEWISTAFGNALDFIKTVDWGQVFASIISFITEFVTRIAEEIANTDWGEAVLSLTDAICDVIEDVDWKELAKSFAKLFSSVTLALPSIFLASIEGGLDIAATALDESGWTGGADTLRGWSSGIEGFRREYEDTRKETLGNLWNYLDYGSLHPQTTRGFGYDPTHDNGRSFDANGSVYTNGEQKQNPREKQQIDSTWEWFSGNMEKRGVENVWDYFFGSGKEWSLVGEKLREWDAPTEETGGMTQGMYGQYQVDQMNTQLMENIGESIKQFFIENPTPVAWFLDNTKLGEKCKSVWENVKKFFQENPTPFHFFIPPLLDLVRKKWEEFTTWWSNQRAEVKLWAGSIKEKVLEKWREFVAWWANIREQIKLNAPNIKQLVQTAWNSFVSWWVGVKQDLTDRFKMPDFKGKLSSAWISFTSWFSQVKQNLADRFKIPDFVGMIKGAWQNLKDWLGGQRLSLAGSISLPHFSVSNWSMNPIDWIRYGMPKINVSWWANGGFLPNEFSLFGMGENGIPEMLGTVGGRTAVAGGAEITGIREAILQQGDQQNTLLRQLVSAVNNKDLSLVANSSTGRWVSKALKAYSGVTG